MSDTTFNDIDENESPTSYSSSTPAAATNRKAITAPGAGTGRWVVNGKTLEAYFPNKVHQQLVSEPFRTVGAEGSYDVFARINGGGVSGQAGALRLGVARSLNEIDTEANRPALKKAGFLKRDARVIERKKYGLKKARKRSQYSKR
jgi:small subunit ribosomal protein S9